jgi:hypothetical protein
MSIPVINIGDNIYVMFSHNKNSSVTDFIFENYNDELKNIYNSYKDSLNTELKTFNINLMSLKFLKLNETF